MCHTDVPPGPSTPVVERREVTSPLPTGEAMPALHARGAGGGPPVLIIADVFGRSPFYEHLASLLAEAGFQALLPDYFFRQGALREATKEAAFARRAQLDENGSLRDLAAAADWLRGETRAAVVGTVGFCMGGTFALDLASTNDDLVSVAYYGFPAAAAQNTSPPAPPRPIDLVDQLRGPVLAFWGDRDETVGMDSVDAYVDAATAGRADFSHRILAGLGHGFLGQADLGDPDDAGGATWIETIDFLRRHLAARA
jgi:carboxymethylenebutenolidase